MLTPRQAANEIGVSLSLIYAWVEGKLLPHYRAGLNGKGGKILIAEADLRAFWESLRVEAAPQQQRATAPPKTKVKLKHIKL